MRRESGLPRARKRFGQHFLEPAWVDKLIRVIVPGPDDHFIEIGPGRGALTAPLAAAARHVAAFEIDRDLAGHLRTTAHPNVTVVEGDFLDASLADVLAAAHPATAAAPLRVAANLPYNAATPIMFRLLDLHAAGAPLADATLMLQREVAERLAAAPGGREYGVLSVLVQHRARVERLLSLPPGAFRPPPAVHSAVVRLRFHPPTPPVRDAALFSDLIRAIFTRRRKTLANALLAYPPAARITPRAALNDAKLDGRRRPETLNLDELVRLADAVTSLTVASGRPAPPH
jgi:16S rRNA (adenine1518-N6/adenine1519-N6)-dimethyltransferase